MVKNFAIMVCGAGIFFLLCAAANAATAEPNPYAPIIDRNIFRLNPAPPPASPESAPPPDVKITGIVKIGAELKALFAIPPKDAKSSATYVCLAEGQQDSGIELLRIFAEKEECEVINGAVRMILSFKNNSYATVSKVSPSSPGR